MEGIKPCPFCGITGIIKTYKICEIGKEDYEYFGTCPNCRLIHGYASTRNEAIQEAIIAWNIRPGEDKLSDHIIKLELFITQIMLEQEFTDREIGELLYNLSK